MYTIHNSKLKELIKPDYNQGDLDKIKQLLYKSGTFEFKAFENGLFPASSSPESYKLGYNHAWIRDNVHVAYALYASGEKEKARKTVLALSKFLGNQKARLEKAESPHIRFIGESLGESSESWSHHQNDALGYFIWLMSLMASKNDLEVSGEDIRLLQQLVNYLKVISYWQDEDSGHWEEGSKISASSVGTVLAGLKMLRQACDVGIILLNKETMADVVQLIESGTESLNQILPFECRQSDPKKFRQYDSALLFLIDPLNIVTKEQAVTIVNNVENNLMGEVGIKRYIGDTFWCPDYRTKLPEKLLTADYNLYMAQRDCLEVNGDEAQWCLFDPILSIIYGRWFEETGDKAMIEKQVYHFNRSLGHITSDFLCPELYFKENGVYVPNDATPLLWTQANFLRAFYLMEKSCSI